MYNIMRIVLLDTLEVYYLDGHSEEDAYASFGNNIEVQKLYTYTKDDAIISDLLAQHDA